MCPARVSLRADVPRKDLGKLVFLICLYSFFYIRCKLVQDFVLFPGAEFFLRIVLLTRILLLFLEKVAPSPSLVDFLRVLPIEPGS